ncbi:esterase-like activity of phytase family protein [Cyanobacteria bacterium FACHB-DQ100]|nr:esterase-like activity of phytase family protein [Cyanobacteria bacterium FACHB-DQ100]
MRRWISWIALVLCVIGLTGCSLPRVNAEDRLFLPLSIEFLGSYTLTDKAFKETTIGGLSGIAYDRKRDLYYAISDDRSDRNPARFYTLKLQIAQNTLKSVEVQNVTTLTDETGQPFAKGTIDPEGIALSPLNSVFVSSEGVTKDGIAPFIGEFDLQTGKLKRKLQMPESYLPDAKGMTQTRGVRDNLGFEALTLNAGASTAPSAEPFRLFAAIESPLAQDLELPTTKESLLNRLLHYQLIPTRSTLISEHAYPLDPKPAGASDSGLTELLSIDQGGHFLSLERSFGVGGFQVKLFQVATGTASDTSSIESLRGAKVRPVRKELLQDLNQLGVRIDNLEAMTIGARLPDGSHSLVLVSDDNFSLGQVTQFLLFRLKGLKG